MSAGRARLMAVLLSVAIASVAGCADGAEGEREGGDRGAAAPAQTDIPEAERARGMEACERYAKRVCACAEAESAGDDLAERCALARSRPEALEMTLGTAGARGDLEPRDRATAVRQAQQIIQRCFEAEAALDPAECPRL